MKKNRISKWLMTALLALPLGGNVAVAQVVSPCPEVLVEQKYDHVISPICRQFGWDTVVGCGDREEMVISAEPYIPVQRFNGTYIVEQIPYNPPDTTFHAGTRMPVSTDDNFSNYATNIPYPFYFFGIRKNSFVLGANGLVAFGPVPVTSNDNTGPGCPWSYSAGLPWTDGTTGAPGNLNYMRDAIYGVYEDTYPSPSTHGSTGDPNWGIYYGVQDEFPCRKIICSWNDVPQFSCTSLRCTYQIVCYEGSNIIEVHVKQREVCNSWNGGNGIIGIQNATGNPQVPSSDPTASNYFVVNGSPAAFWPTGYNPFTTNLNNTAFRFTPQGTTPGNCVWYRIFDDGRDSVQLRDVTQFPDAVNDVNDTNCYGYYEPMNPENTEHPTLTKAHVRPGVSARYVCKLIFKNANNDIYNLYDTISIGVPDKDAFVFTTTDDGDTVKEKKICQNVESNIRLQIPSNQTLLRPATWQVTRVLNGVERVLPSSMYNVNNIMGSLHLNADPEYDTLPTNKIDSIWVRGFVEYTNRCLSSDSVLIRVYPIFDTFDVAGICEGERYYWPHTQQYYTQTTTEPVFDTLSEPGCDSTVHLHLTVYGVSHTYDTIDTCAPLLWQDSILHDHTNTSTISIDTVIKKNIAECDSIVHLVLTIYPVEAHIRSSLQYFDFDNLDVKLDDISTGNASRTWHFPSGPDQTGAEAFWTMPTELDSADIRLIAHSQYGCNDTAHIVIPMNKENVWIPNAFMPDDPQGNNIFSTVSKGTVKQEMYIYNRRGQLVFHCEGTDCGWDGRDGNGDLCPQGAYVYLIRYVNKFNPEKTQVRKGTVTLIR
ncbi:MAG: gliding motility-associated C-terminal domain-containing protein [Bacteroidales bacterium]|nr:gliding motility-associated C-terminal domain-containing protein [Bacteroidales bacterium]